MYLGVPYFQTIPYHASGIADFPSNLLPLRLNIVITYNYNYNYIDHDRKFIQP